MRWATQLRSTLPLTTMNRKEGVPNMNSEINMDFEIDKTVRLFVILAALIAIIVIGSHSVSAQEVAETISIKTRVVFMDALVKDKRTGVPIADLAPENFEISDNGTMRPISYFNREGQARKPLALVLILDLRDDGAGRFLKRREILKAMADELAKLSPADEVAILWRDINGEDEKRVWLTEFTRDHTQIVAALALAPKLVDVDPEDADAKAAQMNKTRNNKSDADHGSSLTLGADSSAKEAAKETPKDASDPGPDTPGSDENVQVEIIQGKNGGVVTRTTRPDDSVDMKRVNKKGDVTIELGDIYAMGDA